jgi:hypothetical protein
LITKEREDKKMKIARIALVIIFVLACAGRGSRMGKASSEGKVETSGSNAASLRSDAPPALLTPFKPVYVTRFGDPFVLLVGVECRRGDIDSTTFELVQPAPTFIHLSVIDCVSKSGNATAVLSVSPGLNDSGTYSVQVIARPCGGGGPATPFNLKIKVKKS